MEQAKEQSYGLVMW